MTEHIFTVTGLIGCEGAQVLHRWARGSNSRSHGSSQARRHERGNMTHRSVRTGVLIFFFGLEIRLILYIFRLRLYQGTSCADGSENHCLVNKR
jgi:hypothetical protein